MSDQVELTNPVELSVGGMSGHILRRGIHLAMSFLPLCILNSDKTLQMQFHSRWLKSSLQSS